MPYKANKDLPEGVRGALPAEAQTTWRTIFNAAFAQYEKEDKASATAWAKLKEIGWSKNEDGEWIKKEYAEFTKFHLNVPISKISDEKKQVFGWASISQEWAKKDDGAFVLSDLVDTQEDMIDPDDLEEMAYKFTKMYREGGEMHIRKKCATMVESMVFTLEKQAALGIPEGIVPVGWWIGFEISDDSVWENVKKGTYRAFSIEGSARREDVV